MRAGAARFSIINRRPLCFAALAYLAGIFAARWFFAVSAAVLAGAGALALLTLLFRLPRSLAICALAFAAAFFVGGSALNPDYSTLTAGQSVVSGRVCEPVEREAQSTPFEKTLVVLSDVSIDGATLPRRVLLEIDGAADLSYGDEIQIDAAVSRPKQAMNPGETDTALKLLIQGVGYVAQAEAQGLEVVGHRGDIYGTLLKTRQAIADKIDALFDSAPVVRGVLLGDTDALDWEQSQVYADLGLYHLFSVSGFHAAIFAGAVVFILRKLHRKRWSLWIAGPLLLAYTALVGFVAPMLRALVMCGFVMGAYLFGRRVDLPTSAAAAMLVILAINPLYAFDIGFQLSFAAVFGMAALLPLFSGLMKKSGLFIKGFLVSFCAQCGTFGLSAYYFNRQSILGFAANIVILPLFSLIIILSMAAVGAGFLFEGAGLFLSGAVDALLRGIGYIAGVMAGVPFAAVSLPSPAVWLVLLLFAVIFIVSPYCMLKVRAKAVVSLVLLLVFAGGYVWPFAGATRAEAVFFSSEGKTVLLHTREGENFIVDDGKDLSGVNVAARYLRKRGYGDVSAVLFSADASKAYKARALEYLSASLAYCRAQGQDGDAFETEGLVPVETGREVELGKSIVFFYGQDGFCCRFFYEGSAVVLLDGEGAGNDGEYTGGRALVRSGGAGLDAEEVWGVVLQGEGGNFPEQAAVWDTREAGAVTARFYGDTIEVDTML